MGENKEKAKEKRKKITFSFLPDTTEDINST